VLFDVHRTHRCKNTAPLYRGVVWMSVCCECILFSRRGLCDVLILCTEESYGSLSVVSVFCSQVEVCATC